MSCRRKADGTAISCTATYQKWTGQPIISAGSKNPPSLGVGSVKLKTKSGISHVTYKCLDCSHGFVITNWTSPLTLKRWSEGFLRTGHTWISAIQLWYTAVFHIMQAIPAVPAVLYDDLVSLHAVVCILFSDIPVLFNAVLRCVCTASFSAVKPVPLNPGYYTNRRIWLIRRGRSSTPWWFANTLAPFTGSLVRMASTLRRQFLK